MDRMESLERDNTLLKSQIRDLKKESNKKHVIVKQHDHKKILESIEDANNNIKTIADINKKTIKSIMDINNNIKKLESVKPVKNNTISEGDILKLICDKIPKQGRDKLTKLDVENIVKAIINLKFVNKLYGKK